MPLFGSNSTHDDPRATELRRCGKCGQDAVTCYHVTVHYVNGIPAGRTYAHKCQRCGRTFETMSVWRTVRDVFFGALCGLFGLFMVPFGTMRIFEVGVTHASGGDWILFGMGWLFALFAVGLAITVSLRTYRLFENPVAQRR